MNFYEKLDQIWNTQDSLVCVGLDPDVSRFPSQIAEMPNCIFEFNRKIVDATAEYACAFKPQIAHFAALGAEDQLQSTIDYIKSNYPDHIVILDAKRGDIGSTAEKYAEEVFQRYGADSVTINPYMGTDAITPFSDTGKGVFVLCRTSNAGAADFQEQTIDGRQLFELIADKAVQEWNSGCNIGLVVGATAPEQMKAIRGRCGDIPFLVPGIGAQGGSVKDVVENGRNSSGRGLLINSSRGIIYSSNGVDFAEAAGLAAKKLRDEIRSFS